MPSQKDLKRLVRARMQKTGESYTAARAQTLKQNAVPPARFAELAGMSDDSVQAKTGLTWKQWVRELDAIGAVGLPHREIARLVHDGYPVSGWWAQTVTVGYERIRGLREIGQKRGGDFNANKSKTYPVPLSRLYRAFSVKRARGRWLPDVELKIRTSTVDKSMRISWPDGTSVHAHFTGKGARKSQLAIQHVGLASKADVAKRKDFWSERFTALGDVLK